MSAHVKLAAWERLRERREATWWRSRWLVALATGGALAAFVEWRAHAAGAATGSHAWLAGALAAFAVAFMRVPFHIYWRADAALLAQLPIDGVQLFGAALRRCVRAAAATFVACVIGAVPLTAGAGLLRYAAFSGVLALCAAALVPAVATGGALFVVAERRRDGVSASAPLLLGALPGFISAVALALVVIAAPWVTASGDGRAAPILGGLAAASLVAIAIARGIAPSGMGAILRDVSALDRQRLATLQIDPPTRIERAVAHLLGDAALPYRKDARLMRRRYPMAFALGSLAFVVLAIVGLAQPADPEPYLVAVIAGAIVYGAALAGRLRRPPIELPRLAATLPITARAYAIAKLAWVAAWAAVYIAVPAAFAVLRSG